MSATTTNIPLTQLRHMAETRLTLEQEVAMLATYVINYGPFEEERTRYWLFSAHLVKNNGWSVEQLNE
jgi:hypothetical protein